MADGISSEGDRLSGVVVGKLHDQLEIPQVSSSI